MIPTMARMTHGRLRSRILKSFLRESCCVGGGWMRSRVDRKVTMKSTKAITANRVTVSR